MNVAAACATSTTTTTKNCRASLLYKLFNKFYAAAVAEERKVQQQLRRLYNAKVISRQKKNRKTL